MLPWLYLLLAAVALAVAFKTSSIALAILCLLVALVLTGAWLLGLLAQRVGNRSRDAQMMIDPQELRRLREQAEARRAAAAPDEPQT
jgi:hypothetical protein